MRSRPTLPASPSTQFPTWYGATQEAQRRYPGLPVLCSGGVASNSQLRSGMIHLCGAIFAQPEYSTDNAMGTAILTWRALNAEAER